MNDLSPLVDPTDNLADQRVGSGIIVLSASMQLLHMNRQASELSKLINAAEQTQSNRKSGHGVLPTALTELCGEIIKALHVRTEAKDWEQFEIKRVAGNPEKPILLAGVWLTGPRRGSACKTRRHIGRVSQTTTAEYRPSQGKVSINESRTIRY